MENGMENSGDGFESVIGNFFPYSNGTMAARNSIAARQCPLPAEVETARTDMRDVISNSLLVLYFPRIISLKGNNKPAAFLSPSLHLSISPSLSFFLSVLLSWQLRFRWEAEGLNVKSDRDFPMTICRRNSDYPERSTTVRVDRSFFNKVPVSHRPISSGNRRIGRNGPARRRMSPNV